MMATVGRALAALPLVLAVSAATADEALKVAVGARGAYENQVSEVGNAQGIFKARGLALEVLYTQGGGESLQAVISGSVDVGISIGTLGALGAFAKGAPIRVLGGSMIGSYEFWYVRADSPIRSFRDAAGKTVAYSTKGSSTNLMALSWEQKAGVTFEPVATGNPVATLTQVMSGQIDVGYTTPPIAVEALDKGEIRMIGRGDDLADMARQTVRLIVVNAGALEQRPDAFRRYMQGYRDTLDWMYASPDAIPAYAKWAGVPESVARRTRDEFVPKKNAEPDTIAGLDAAMADAVTYKYLAAPLTADQLRTLIRIQEPLK